MRGGDGGGDKGQWSWKANMVWQWESQVARTGLGEAGAEGGVELKLDAADMAGDNDI